MSSSYESSYIKSKDQKATCKWKKWSSVQMDTKFSPDSNIEHFILDNYFGFTANNFNVIVHSDCFCHQFIHVLSSDKDTGCYLPSAKWKTNKGSSHLVKEVQHVAA